MKNALAVIVISILAVLLTGCASMDEIQQTITALETTINAIEAENATLRAELQAVADAGGADAGGEDSEAARSLADALERNESFIATAQDAIDKAQAALDAAGGETQEFWWEMGVGVAGLFGFGGVATVLNNARRRNAEAFRAVVTGFEKARESNDGNTFDMSTVGRIVADAGITSRVDAIRKEVSA